MSSSLSNLVDNLSEGLHNDRCIDSKSCLDDMTTKDEQLIFRYFECKKNYKKDFNKELINKLSSTYKFCNGDINNFILLLRKGVYPYEYMDCWERFNETSLPYKEAFYSNLTMEDITDVDYRHAKTVFNEVAPKNLSNKNLGDYHDLYVQSDKLLLADVFENFSYMCIKVYELDPANFLSAPGLAWQACRVGGGGDWGDPPPSCCFDPKMLILSFSCSFWPFCPNCSPPPIVDPNWETLTCLKKTEVELELTTDPDMLLMAEKGIRGEICHAILRYAKANNKHMKDYNKDQEESFLEHNVRTS